MGVEEVIHGDALEGAEEFAAEGKEVVFLHGCNAQGVMGSGVARQVRDRWPFAYMAYAVECRTSNPEDLTGDVVWAEDPGGSGITVANAVTQKNYGQGGPHARLEWIFECHERIYERYEGTVGPSIEFVSVKVGCGLGGLTWDLVSNAYWDSPLPWTIYYL